MVNWVDHSNSYNQEGTTQRKFLWSWKSTYIFELSIQKKKF